MTKVTYPFADQPLVDKNTGLPTVAWQRFFQDLWTRVGKGNDSLFAADGENGRVGIGTDNPSASTILELSSTTGGFLLPRMTTTQRNALTAVNGMFIYNSTDNKFQGYENGSWTNLI